MNTKQNRSLARHSAFTLVELLVVITIIALLAGLLVTAASSAMRSARETSVKLEINTVEQAIEQYKNEVSGGAYPPDAMIGDLPVTGGGAAVEKLRNQLQSDFDRHFKKAFNRNREEKSLLQSLMGLNTSAGTNQNLEGGISPSEAVVFWMQRFSDDTKYPISGSGGPSFVVGNLEDVSSRNWIGNLDQTRLGPRDADGNFNGRFLLYTNQGQQRRINFWEYYPPKSPQPLVYFDASRGLHDLEHPALTARGIEVHPFKKLKTGITPANPPLINQLRLANEGKYQIMHCGLDEEWGEFGTVGNPGWLTTGSADLTQPALDEDGTNGVILYPDGPFSDALADTIVNFSDKNTLEDSQP